jgi:hypothetical protein
MLYREINVIAICSQIHTKHINTLCGQNADLLNIIPCGTYGRQLDLKTDVAKQSIQAAFWFQSKFICRLSTNNKKSS